MKKLTIYLLLILLGTTYGFAQQGGSSVEEIIRISQEKDRQEKEAKKQKLALEKKLREEKARAKTAATIKRPPPPPVMSTPPPSPHILNASNKKVAEGTIINKYDLYAFIKHDLYEKKLSTKWLISERDNNFIISRNNSTLYDKNNKSANKNYEIIVHFEYYPTNKFLADRDGGDELKNKLNSIARDNHIDEIKNEESTKLYFAKNRDERNRLVNYFLSKAYLEKNLQDANVPDFYVENNKVTISIPQDYARITPEKIPHESEIIQYAIKDRLVNSLPNR